MENLNSQRTAEAVLPAGHYYAVTWSIPDNFGGMTSALLRRSRAFVREAGQEVDVLTFAYNNSYDDVRWELETSGELIPGIRLRNLWEELSTLAEDELLSAVPARDVKGSFRPLPFGVEEDFTKTVNRRIRYDALGETTLQVDYCRVDGSVFVTDQRDLDNSGFEGGRRVTLCDHSGSEVAAWNQMWPLYLFWLDRVTASKETYIIVDSKSTANFMTRYQRDNVATIHMVHNSHVASGQVPPHGALSSVRKYVFDRLSSFDGVVLLTEKQKQDVDMIYKSGNTYVVPNSTELPDRSVVDRPRDKTQGVMLASLTHRKRIDHALGALAKANSTATLAFVLVIYGQGPERDALERLSYELKIQANVKFAGQISNPRERLEQSSFVLLTSRMEGLPLVLLEAMSVGCIPIAYDIPYGPSAVIDDGINGFLVDGGDKNALASRILQIERLSSEDLTEMRRQARLTAESFSDPAVTAKWSEVLCEVRDRKIDTLLREYEAVVPPESLRF